MKIIWWNREKKYYTEEKKQEDEKTLELLQQIKTKQKFLN